MSDFAESGHSSLLIRVILRAANGQKQTKRNPAEAGSLLKVELSPLSVGIHDLPISIADRVNQDAVHDHSAVH